MEKRYQASLRRFEEALETELSEERIGEYECLNALRSTEEEMSAADTPEEERRRILDALAEEMVEYADRRLSREAKRVYESARLAGELDTAGYEHYREELFFFDQCFKNVHEELERFTQMHSENPLGEERLRQSREALIRFEQLIQTYVRLLELQAAASRQGTAQ